MLQHDITRWAANAARYTQARNVGLEEHAKQCATLNQLKKCKSKLEGFCTKYLKFENNFRKLKRRMRKMFQMIFYWAEMFFSIARMGSLWLAHGPTISGGIPMALPLITSMSQLTMMATT
uniref:Uncharacterized protein n=1 Tax=Romanomermis culicivorax TaxID=13658 RepID=A0A915K248_ROMCU